MLKIVLSAVVLCVIETINGIVRIHFFTKHFGRKRAKTISFVFGLLGAAFAMLFLVPWVAPSSIEEALILGLVWTIFLGAYDVWVGKVLFKLPWEKIAEDFDLRKGNLLGLGFLAVLFLPSLIFLLSN